MPDKKTRTVTGFVKAQASKGKNYTRLHIAAFLLAVAPLCFLVFELRKYVVNVPFWDQWEFVTIIEKSNEGHLGFGDFFAQHNEHRILFPRIFMYIFAKISHWNVLYETGFSVFLAIISFILLILILKKTITGQKLFLAGTVILSMIFFSPLQWENWLWGWQIQWFLSVLGIIAAVWSLYAWRTGSARNKIILAAAACFLATYSIGSGFFGWFICLPLLVYNEKLKKYLPLWLALGTVTIASHYLHYDPISYPSKSLFLHQPVNFLHYLATYITRPVLIDFLLSSLFAGILLGAIGIVAAFLLLRKRQELRTSLLPWLCFAAYGVLAAVSTAISRLGLGLEQAYSSRYVTLSNFFIIALIVVFLKTCELTSFKVATERLIKIFCIVMLCVGVLLVSVNYAKGVEQMKYQHQHLLKVRHCAHTATSESDDCLLLLYPDKAVVWKRLTYLRSIHWGGL